MALARRFVRDIATDWTTVKGVPEIAEFLVFEPFTNAITHGAADTHPSPAVRVTVVREGELMRVETYDSPRRSLKYGRQPQRRLFGRGLAIAKDLPHD